MGEEINKDFDDVKDMVESKLIIGDTIKIDDDRFLIPVFKTKINYLHLNSKVKGDLGGTSASVNMTPLCFVETSKAGIKLHHLNHDFSVNDCLDKAPDLLSSLGKLFDFDLGKK